MLSKVEKYLGGIKDMPELPGAIFVVDPRKESIAIQEAHRLGIPVVGLVDTNCSPENIDYVIPGNDDAVKSVKVVIGSLTNAIIEANGGTIVDYVSEDDKKPSKEKSFVKRDKIVETSFSTSI